MLRTAILLLSSTVIITCLPESDWSSLHPTASTKHREAQISHVPGYASNRLPSKHYGGYITVDEDHGRRLYYYFVTSERSPSRDPVVLWLNGGPGCSSFDGFVYEHGPFKFGFKGGKDSTGRERQQLELTPNPHSWSKVANVLYVDSPAGVGMSYSETKADYRTNDTRTAADMDAFLRRWFREYSEFQGNDFFVSGESFAGVYVPLVTQAVVRGNEEGQGPKLNIKGYIVGNGVTDPRYDGDALVPFAHGKSLISTQQYEDARHKCGGSYWNASRGSACDKALFDIWAGVSGLNIYGILSPCYHGHNPYQQAQQAVQAEVQAAVQAVRQWPLLGGARPGEVPGLLDLGLGHTPPCLDSREMWAFCNSEEVRRAIHAAPISKIGRFDECTNGGKIHYTHDVDSMIPVHQTACTNRLTRPTENLSSSLQSVQHTFLCKPFPFHTLSTAAAIMVVLGARCTLPVRAPVARLSVSRAAPKATLPSISKTSIVAQPLPKVQPAAIKGLPQLPKRAVKVQASSNVPVVAAAAVPEPEEKKFLGVPMFTWQKILPLGLMFFSILFNYTILRDTKDVLVVTAPGSGAEIIPFLKTYLNLPLAIAFTVAYTKLANVLNNEQLFYTCIFPFIAFFGAFAFVLYPMRDILHPTEWAVKMLETAGPRWAGPIAIIRNWTYCIFYVMAELWGSVVVSVLFWGFANQITTVKEAEDFYPLFGLGANVALIFSGRAVKMFSQIRANLPPGVDGWGVSLRGMMSMVVGFGLVIVAIFYYLNRTVVPRVQGTIPKREKKKKKEPMGVGESFVFLAKSQYIRDLAWLVVAYGISINLVEVTWKSKIKAQFPNPNDYSAFMGDFSTATGAVTFTMMIVSRFIFNKFGWGVAALITPTVLLITGVIFFSLVLFSGPLTPTLAAMGLTPLYAAVLIGAAQNIFSKASKYALFDPCKEMAYIPLDNETKTKGKAAVDVVCNPLGKSGGSFIQQIMIIGFGSLAASTPYLGVILFFIVGTWILAANDLSKLFKKAQDEQRAAAAAAEAGSGNESA